MTNERRNIPLVDLKRQHAQIDDQVRTSFDEILGSMRLFLGPNVKAFEKEFAEYLGVDHAVGVSDGTMALHLALRACGVRPGDEVITVSHTFFATVEAIVLAGAVPVFVDINPETLTMDVTLVEKAITPRTRAIIPVHLYGRMADVETVVEIAHRFGIRVIEDAAQAHGARRDGKAAGTIGDAGCFSFYYSKNLGAYGEAGGVVSYDSDIARRVELLRDHGSAIRYRHADVGVNGRLDELQAAVLRAKLPRLDGWNERRRGHAARYERELCDLPVTTPAPAGLDHVHHLYVIRCSERRELQNHLESRGVHTGIHYPIPCHLQPACRGYQRTPLPVTERVVDEILSLPMFPELEASEVDYVVAAVAEYYSAQRLTEIAAAE